jgi:hypothetical protein
VCGVCEAEWWRKGGWGFRARHEQERLSERGSTEPPPPSAPSSVSVDAESGWVWWVGVSLGEEGEGPRRGEWTGHRVWMRAWVRQGAWMDAAGGRGGGSTDDLRSGAARPPLPSPIAASSSTAASGGARGTRW